MHANPSTSVVCQPLLTPVECAALVRAVPAASWEPGRILAPAGTADAEPPIRRCRQSRAVDPALARRTEEAVARLGAAHYRFALTGPSASDPTLIVRYDPGDHFTWHIDNGSAGAPFATRKLSFIVQLSAPGAYEGGDLELAMYAQAYGGAAFETYRAQMRAQGSLTVFPSFHLHCVRALARGVRYALVGWLHGPEFR